MNRKAHTACRKYSGRRKIFSFGAFRSEFPFGSGLGQTEKSQNSPSGKVLKTQKNPAEIERFQPDFSVFSELFPMENSVTFPSDPNLTQTGVRSGTRRNAQSRRLPELFRQAACAFLFISCRYPTLAMKLLIFCAASFFMPAVTCVYTSSENSAEAWPRISATVFGSMPLWIASVENVCLRS